ncbi:hypothetical protein SFC79_02675 [Nocardioides sp. S-58]|uniref:Lipoprotein n=1 Tax=Nocardioides renjunii TaxID=3095075 RepID=A0ABU5K6Q6_9ACTN|nr:hypothetical protein [Nocardioides sp. S-58]MDZ5660657.1 hypothetical protein [Nocardioides sp. S-58]
MRGAVLGAALVVALAACGGEPEQRAEPEPTPSAGPATTEAVDEPLPCVPGAEPFTGPAADEFGAEQVMAAYCMLADLAFAQERTSLALPVPEQDERDLRSVRAVLTTSALERWRERADVDGLTLHDVRRVPRGYQRADDGPFVYGTTVGPATARREGDALSLSFALETGLVLEERGDDTGRHSLLPVTRDATYVLVPVGGGWKVADWEAKFTHGPVRLVSG